MSPETASAMFGGTTVHLVAIRDDLAVVRIEDRQVGLSWADLHSAQQAAGPLGATYGYLMRQYCLSEYAQRQGKPWTSPARTVDEIHAEAVEQQAQQRRAEEERRAAERAACETARQRDLESLERSRVQAERRSTEETATWWPAHSWEVPDAVRFDVLPRDQGQIVEVAYGTFNRGEACHSDPYMRVIDRSDPPTTPPRYYQRRDLKTQG